MAYGLQIRNSSGETTLDTTVDVQSVAVLSDSVTITTNSSGSGTSSSISFPGMTASNTDEYAVYFLQAGSGSAYYSLTVTRSTNSFTITLSNGPTSSTATVSYLGLRI
jgi:hypothetical protein